MRASLLLPVFCIVAVAMTSAAVETLPEFNVDKDLLTVSGISAGAYFASQFHVAFSSVIQGCGSWAGGPYLCYSKNSLICMTSPSIIDVDALIKDTEKLAAAGKIDQTVNLIGDRVYLFHGTKDTTVRPLSSEKMEEYYLNFASEVVLKNDLDASHAVVSDHAGSRCGVSDNRLYIENCDHDSVHNMMDHVLGGGLNPPLTPGVQLGNLIEFDQNEFFDGDADAANMDETGFVYVPAPCADGVIQCRLHIFFHGCTMYADNIGTDFITESGLIQVADANNIVIIFPQSKSKLVGGNVNGCFNWFGYLSDLLNEKYATKEAVQMAGSYEMLARAAKL